MNELIKNDKVSSIEEVNINEKKFSAAAIQLARVLQMGTILNQEERITQAMRTENAIILPLDGLLKDHKINLPMRPLCRSNESPNSTLGDLLSDIIKLIADEVSEITNVECRSTEDLIYKIGDANIEISKIENRGETIEITIGSSDVKNMFPALDIEKVSTIIEKQIKNSKYIIEVNSNELSLLTVSLLPLHKIPMVLRKYLHTRTHKHGSKPGITSKVIVGSEKEHEEINMWTKPKK